MWSDFIEPIVKKKSKMLYYTLSIDVQLLARLQKNIRFDFDDELKIRDVRYKHLT